MSKKLINALRLIAGAVAGYAVAYMWWSIRPEDDWAIIIGAGVVSGILTFVLLFLMGKGGGD